MRSAIIGGGVAGVRAAVELDNRRGNVLLVEKNFYIGGKLTELSRMYPVCELYFAPRFFSQLNDSGNVEILTGSEIIDIEKNEIGNRDTSKKVFNLMIRKIPRYVTDECTLCLKCVEICPKGAVQKPPFQSIPQIVFIDRKKCEDCGKCEEICPENAINFSDKEEIIKREVTNLLFCTGSELFSAEKYSEFGYKRFSNVVTSIELEKMLHPSFDSEFARPSDGRRPQKIAFLQCVGSRDSVKGELYCSRICCMQALNEARVIKERYPDTEVYIFFTDLQCSGKKWEQFCEETKKMGVTCMRYRIPALYEENGNIVVTYAQDELVAVEVDLAVLSVGISPPVKSYGLPLNEFGFPVDKACGFFSHPQDITESVQDVLASLSRIPGGEPQSSHAPEPGLEILLCNCGNDYSQLADKMRKEGHIVHYTDNLCRNTALGNLRKEKTVVGACSLHEQLFLRLAKRDNSFVEVVPLRERKWVTEDPQIREKLIRMAVAKLEHLDTSRITRTRVKVFPAIVIIGGGVAGLTAALDLADTYEVFIVEKSPLLGGRALTIQYSLNDSPQEIVQDLIKRAETHFNIKIFTETEIKDLEGEPGNFIVKTTRSEITCGAIIVAVGADEFQHQYSHPKIVTQTQLEDKIRKNDIPSLIVMVQCIGSRNDENPWCSAVCCSKAVLNSLKILENCDAQILILYRDMRTYGFHDAFYRKAREKGVIFLQNDEMPSIRVDDSVFVTYRDPILNTDIVIEPDLLVLSTGITPREEFNSLADILGISLDWNGFFKELHPKFFPTDTVREGIFLCGLCHSPRNIKESIVQAKAAASRTRTFLSSDYETYTRIAVNEDVCMGCSICVKVCPFKAISLESNKVSINMSLCKDCGLCVGSCPVSALIQTTLSDEQLLNMVGVL
ncbi:MAG: CoB--CoM heterodisulfide reductase iron-sulfur subunit A family protein [Theionarchaea archaeon]|nr:CoB--CoM heterodisulfide reductase iron-sulfur subunit A family protein [Theionarchaea archaeon]